MVFQLKSAPYLSPEELAELERKDKEEYERRRLMLADDMKDRGLNAMMDGALQKLWQDEIKKDVPKPEFMVGNSN